MTFNGSVDEAEGRLTRMIRTIHTISEILANGAVNIQIG